MNASASFCIKLLSLAVVICAVLGAPWLASQSTGWVPWMALVLLILLEAFASDSKPATWSQWSVGLRRLLEPGMLPYYAVLAVLLAIGPGQVRQTMPQTLPGKFDRSGVLAVQQPAATTAPARPTSFPGGNAPPRPATFKPAPTGQLGSGAGNPSSKPAVVPGNPANGGPAKPPVQSFPSAKPPAPNTRIPSSSATPPAAPAK